MSAPWTISFAAGNDSNFQLIRTYEILFTLAQVKILTSQRSVSLH
jgi:hypothetical protein